MKPQRYLSQTSVVLVFKYYTLTSWSRRFEIATALGNSVRAATAFEWQKSAT
jgi:hypothetical protein